ncbi:hypothetical protein R3W88_026815 [Solanum pinnatisectum]|uniref:Uncharacterized protein n=1 Tax=Solanum pinnatisectum TaxID=50273 RepID=A0AAV9LEI8_9SOLN|nr:hypothetical protein R3W88_026815 [Solanum pinnatisectum]
MRNSLKGCYHMRDFFCEKFACGLFVSTNQSHYGKKFAKPELKSCIEEFEENFNKFDIERKEQELTAKNAQSHQQKVESLESITVTEKEEEEIGESEITKGSFLQVYCLFIQLLLFHVLLTRFSF